MLYETTGILIQTSGSEPLKHTLEKVFAANREKQQAYKAALATKTSLHAPLASILQRNNG